MTIATITPLENTVQTSHQWLEELASALGRDDPQQAYRILHAVLVVLRDRLTAEEATDLGAQLPMLIRGLYYEGYNPSKTPTRERNKQEFLNRVAENLQDLADGDPEQAVQAVFQLISQHITDGEINHVKANLPKDIQALWEA